MLALLRGSLPESPVTSALTPLLAPFAVFPGVSGDTLEVNARFTVHQYGLAHLLLVGGGLRGGGSRARTAPERSRSAAGSHWWCWCRCCWRPRRAARSWRWRWPPRRIAAFRTRLAWLIPPLAGGLIYVLLARGTISRGVEAEWLNQRLGYWTGTVSLLGDVPLTGAGLGMRTFAEVFAWYHQLPDPYQVSHTHNVVIQAYAEQGLLGAIGLAGLLVVGVAIGLASDAPRPADRRAGWWRARPAASSARRSTA